MAVTASSAFPGFFPPLELTGADVGASSGEFGRQAYTDGGVFDNLGVRLFRCLERPLLAESPLSATTSSISRRSSRHWGGRQVRPRKRRCAGSRRSCVAERQPTGPAACSPTPARRAGRASGRRRARAGREPAPSPPSGPGAGDGDGRSCCPVLWDLMRHYPFHREPLFAGLRPADPDAEALLRASRPGRPSPGRPAISSG